MEILERIWEIVTAIGNAILGRFERGITALFGSANARFIRRLAARRSRRSTRWSRSTRR